MLPRRHHVDAHTASWWRRRARRRARATAPVLIHLCLLGQVFLVGCFGETSTSAWTVRATALQRYLGYDVPLDKLTLTATHNSFTSDRDPLTHSNFEVVPAQIYSVTDQLSCLGVRGIELDPHYIVELATDGNEKSAVRLCHTSALAATQVIEVCDTFGWDLCEEAGVPNFGTNTGCREDAPTLREGFEERSVIFIVTWRTGTIPTKSPKRTNPIFAMATLEIAVWLSLEENAQEVVFIKLDSYLDDQSWSTERAAAAAVLQEVGGRNS